MIFENAIHRYTHKYLEKKLYIYFFSNLLLTTNVPLQIGKYTPT